jgi:transposase
MLDTNEAAQRVRGRAEVLGSVVRRRRWTAAEKGRIVAEAIGPGAVVAEAARRHDLTPQHLSNWIRAAKAGRLVLPEEAALGFVPVVSKPARPATSSQIEIVSGSLVVRIPERTDARTIETVLRVLAQR